MKYATVDIGTNTTLLLVADVDAEGRVQPVMERAEITRLGRGIGGDGQLRPDNIKHTLEVLRAYAAIAHSHGTAIAAIGTEGLRRAPNAQDFLQPATGILGSPVQVISGEREAELTFLAAARSFPDEARGGLLVVDIGGGSTELIFAPDGQIAHAESVPLGSVRLTERFIHHDPAHADERAALQTAVDEAVAEAFARAGFAGAVTLIGTAGTVTTLAAMAQGLADYDSGRVHGFALARAALDGQVERLAPSRQDERERMPGLDPRRADVILAGAILLQAIMRRAAVPLVRVSDRGIRWGLLFELMATRQA
jgi:exopolyphosphatase/guanosine-5'-triphosphate,3'-diphosphate pyrophosphatase